MDNYEFIEGGRELLEEVKPLWEMLNIHHEKKSTNFSSKFKGFTFEERTRKYEIDRSIVIRVDLIKDRKTIKYIGYCISTISRDNIGEVDSLFLEKEYRKNGLGEELMERALNWMNKENVKKKIIGVAEGNEYAIGFYEKFGFCKRTTILEQK